MEKSFLQLRNYAFGSTCGVCANGAAMYVHSREQTAFQGGVVVVVVGCDAGADVTTVCEMQKKEAIGEGG